MTLIVKQDIPHRIGIADGLFNIPDDIDECNDEIAEMFYGGDDLS